MAITSTDPVVRLVARYLSSDDDWESNEACGAELLTDAVNTPATTHAGIVAKVKLWLAVRHDCDDDGEYILERIVTDLQNLEEPS